MRKYQYYNTGDDADRDIYGVNWSGQTFTPEIEHMIANVRVKLFRVGDPSTITVSIKETSAGKPVGADLCSGTIEGNTITDDAGGDWYQISMGNGCEVEKDVQYAIVIQASAGDVSNKLSWRTDASAPTYTGGLYCGSTDSGTDWSTYSGSDAMFEEWGAGAPSTQAVVWGNLYKSQISLEKIETAVLRMIQDHEDDEDAHVEVGESLYSHKASEIIDHLVDSIITDKIKDGEITNVKITVNSRAYTAVVDAAGLADYTDIQLAINYVHGLGGGKILIVPGTYTINANLLLYDDVAIEGLKKSECIIDFNGSHGQIITFTDYVEYDTGSISVPNNSDIVTGVGTAWNANVTAGQYIRIYNLLYEIKTVDNDTQLTLVNKYQGIAVSGLADYDTATYLKNCLIKNLSIKNGGYMYLGTTPFGAIYLTHALRMYVENCDIIDSLGSGIQIQKVFNSDAIKNNSIGAAGKGIHLINSAHNNIKDNPVFGAPDDGLYVDNDSHENTIKNNILNQNKKGMVVYGDNNIVIGNRASENKEAGITIIGDDNIYSQNMANKNGDAGINVQGNANILNGNIANYNANHGVYLSAGNRNIINGNIAKDNTGYGIRNYAGALNIIIANIAKDNTTGQIIDVTGTAEIAHNQIT